MLFTNDRPYIVADRLSFEKILLNGSESVLAFCKRRAFSCNDRLAVVNVRSLFASGSLIYYKRLFVRG